MGYGVHPPHEVLRPIPALRRDLESGALRGAGDDDAVRWLALATGLEHGVRTARHALAPRGAAQDDGEGHAPFGARELEALVNAVEASGQAPRWSMPHLDREQSAEPAVRELQRLLHAVEMMEEAGAFHLASAVLPLAEWLLDSWWRHGVAHDGAPLTPAQQHALEQERGRLWAQQARVTWQRGRRDLSRAIYDRVGRLGRRLGDPELCGRKWFGLAVIAQLENDPARVRVAARRALQHAEAIGLRPMIMAAHSTLLAAAGMQQRWSDALVHAWAAFEVLDEGHPLAVVPLGNLSQLLLELGRMEAARVGFEAVLEREPPPRVRVPAAGGLARVYAALGDVEGVRRMERDVALRAEQGAAGYLVEDARRDIALAHQVLSAAGATPRPRLSARGEAVVRAVFGLAA